MYYSHHDTIVALATAQGVGALSVIRVSGPKAIEIVNNIFKGPNLNKQASHTIHYGYIVTNNNDIIDEVLVSIFKSPKSFTTEDTIEISCHGSIYIVESIIQLIINSGARLAQPGEFTKRAFINGRLDLIQAEAVADLINSKTKISQEISINQIKGEISKRIISFKNKLVQFLSLIELELDFSEEDVEFASRRQIKTEIKNVLIELKILINSFKVGNAIKNGIPIVITGRPNAGKSSLLNWLIEEERVIVSEIAGTTRDTIEEVFTINNIEFRFIDTAGIRDTNDLIESIGINKALEKIKQARLVLYVFDVNELTLDEVNYDIKKINKPLNDIIVIGNKIDKINEILPSTHSFQNSLIYLSVTNQASEDLANLKKIIYQKAIGEGLTDFTGELILSNTRHVSLFSLIINSLEETIQGIDQRIYTELLAVKLRQSIQYLGELTGEITTEDILTNIFSKFCIGK